MPNYVKMLKLEKHIEGGFFGIFYESKNKVRPLNGRYSQEQTTPSKSDDTSSSLEKQKVIRSAGTSIYFLLENHAYSAWHRLKSDEIWHYYDGGSPIIIHTIDKKGDYKIHTLGNPNSTANGTFQIVIEAGQWFAAEVFDKSSFGLVGCTVSPGFEYNDFELADLKSLSETYPKLEEVIKKFTISTSAMQSQPDALASKARVQKPSQISAKDYISKLHLEKHIEGGYFQVIYKAVDNVIPLNRSRTDTADTAHDSIQEQRSAGSSIYFLLQNKDFSAWHKLKSDELWHYYDGTSPIDIHMIDLEGKLQTLTLGNPNTTENACFQVAIPSENWFAAEVRDKASFGLIGCTVSPGFEYQDFELADRQKLVSEFPEYSESITRLTRNKPVQSHFSKS